MILRPRGAYLAVFCLVFLALNVVVDAQIDGTCFNVPLYENIEGIINSTIQTICLSIPRNQFPSYTEDIPETYQALFTAEGTGKENLCVSVSVTNATHESSATQCQPQAADNVPFCFNVRKATMETLQINISCIHYFPSNKTYVNHCANVGNIKFAVIIERGCSKARSWTFILLLFAALLLTCVAIYFGVRSYSNWQRRRMYHTLEYETSPLHNTVSANTNYNAAPTVRTSGTNDPFVPQGTTAPSNNAMRDFMSYVPMK